MNGKIYLDGRIVDPEQATISVFARGFLYGDSSYETVRVYSGVAYAWDLHVERWYGSAGRIGWRPPWPPEHLQRVLTETLAASCLREAYVRMIGTRGQGALGLDPGLARDPKLILFVLELPPLPSELYERGRSVRLVSVARNLKAALDPQAKTGNYMNSILALSEARAHGADDAILLDVQGRIAEASSANVFALLDGIWCTPPLEVGILGGITRQTLLRLCGQHGVPAAERELWPADLKRAAEICLCSSVREVVPVVRLDERPVGDGRVGSGARRLLDIYRSAVRAYTDHA